MEKESNFYSNTGDIICYTIDGEYLYLQNGNPAGYIYNNKVYSYSGLLLGWYSNGWLYDRYNNPALFSESSKGGPIRPVRKVRPVRGVRGVRPVKGVKQVAHVRSVKSLTWSAFSGVEYFNQ